MRLIACGGRKGPAPAPAGDLYTGGLFGAARRWAEQSPDGRWGIVSGLHGYLSPDTVVAPYDHKPQDWKDILEALDSSPALPEHGELEVAAPLRYYLAVKHRYPHAVWVFQELPDKRMGYQINWLQRHTTGVR